MYAKTTEDLDGSNEDLIGPPRMSENAFGYAQLQLGADEVNTGHTPYAVIVNSSPSKSRIKNRQILVIFFVLFLFLICIVFISLYVSKAKEIKSLKKSHLKNTVCTTPGCIDAASFMQTAMDRSAGPCNNFYQYACGGWIAKNPIPEQQSRWGVDSVLANQNLYAMRHALEETDRTKTVNADDNDAEQKARHFYKACMQTDAIKKAGSRPLLNVMKNFSSTIYKYKDKRAKVILTETLAFLKREYGIPGLFGTDVGVDARNSTRNAIQIVQSGLFLPQAWYNASMTDKVLSAYLKYMVDITMLIGPKNRTASVQLMTDILNFEKNLSKIYVPRENMTDINKAYTKMTIRELQKLSPVIEWLTFYKKIFAGRSEITADQEVIVLAKPYLEKLPKLISETSPKVLDAFCQWKLISSLVPYLSDEFLDARKDLDIALYGTHIKLPRWQRCVKMTDSAIGFAIGALFVKEKFPGKSKQVAADMVEKLRAAFIESLPNIDWMDDATRDAVKEKALAVFPKIGYPELIMDKKKLNEMYKDVKFAETGCFENILRLQAWSTLVKMRQLHKPVDKKVWYMTPSTVNAYYDPARNQIVFPAGILQPPYFDTRYPKSVNYGGIGAVIGHELLHGFDNEGHLFDKNGNSGKALWTKHAEQEFRKKEKCFIDEYGNYSIKGKHINGKATLGENIADNGGLAAAYNAYRSWVKKNGEELPLPGLKITNEQAFFVSFAQSWCTSARTAAIHLQLESDAHSPAMDRVLGSISNSNEFAKAFNCPASSKYNPKRKCKIW